MFNLYESLTYGKVIDEKISLITSTTMLSLIDDRVFCTCLTDVVYSEWFRKNGSIERYYRRAE